MYVEYNPNSNKSTWNFQLYQNDLRIIDNGYIKMGVSADGQVSVYVDDETKAHHGYPFPDVIQIPKRIELDGQMILRLPVDCDDEIEEGISKLKAE